MKTGTTGSNISATTRRLLHVLALTSIQWPTSAACESSHKPYVHHDLRHLKHLVCGLQYCTAACPTIDCVVTGLTLGLAPPVINSSTNKGKCACKLAFPQQRDPAEMECEGQRFLLYVHWAAIVIRYPGQAQPSGSTV